MCFWFGGVHRMHRVGLFKGGGGVAYSMPWNASVFLRLVGTRLMEHAPVYKTMGFYVSNIVLTGLALNRNDYIYLLMS